MGIINVKQNTKDWREWRDKGLGASDAPIVMGKSPWTTRFQLWGQKTGLLERPEPNAFQVAAMKRGHDLEPEARRRCEKLLGAAYPATSFEHSEHAFLRASLDGYNNGINLEIKCPGKVDHQKALAGFIPDKYYPQLQMQMIVSGANLTKYYSWDGKDSDILMGVPSNQAYQDNLLKEMIAFWKLIQTKTPPALGEGELESMLLKLTNTLTQCQNTIKLLSTLNEDQLINVSKGDE